MEGYDDVKFETPFGEVDIPHHSGSSGIALSGGVDSAILLYIMVMTLDMRPRVMFLENANSSEKAAREVLALINEWCATDLELQMVPRFTTGTWLRHDINGMLTNLNVLYTGVTGNPPVDFGHTPPNRPRSNTDPRYVTPFLSLDKRASVFLYDHLNIGASLMDATHSCTTSLETPCGQCFQCREKQWAIEEVTRVR